MDSKAIDRAKPKKKQCNWYLPSEVIILIGHLAIDRECNACDVAEQFLRQGLATSSETSIGPPAEMIR